MTPVFYEDSPSQALRFGDVIQGFVTTSARVDSPSPTIRPEEYSIEVKAPEYAVILTPCCSIGRGCLCLAPLQQILPGFLDNPFLEADLTRVNRPMRPEQSVPPDRWASMGQEEKDRRFDANRPLAFAFNSFFIYAPHDLLPSYSLNRRGGPVETAHYLIDFSAGCRIECKEIHNAQQAPLQTKLLELTVQARSDLREKMADYFGRVPAEDLP